MSQWGRYALVDQNMVSKLGAGGGRARPGCFFLTPCPLMPGQHLQN